MHPVWQPRRRARYAPSVRGGDPVWCQPPDPDMSVQQHAQRSASKSVSRATDSLGAASSCPPAALRRSQGRRSAVSRGKPCPSSCATTRPRRVIVTSPPVRSTRRMIARQRCLHSVTKISIPHAITDHFRDRKNRHSDSFLPERQHDPVDIIERLSERHGAWRPTFPTPGWKSRRRSWR